MYDTRHRRTLRFRLPIEPGFVFGIIVSTGFELVVNAKSAKALGLQIPQELLLRADRVIE